VLTCKNTAVPLEATRFERPAALQIQSVKAHQHLHEKQVSSPGLALRVGGGSSTEGTANFAKRVPGELRRLIRQNGCSRLLGGSDGRLVDLLGDGEAALDGLGVDGHA
jgi:hypothetical protein